MIDFLNEHLTKIIIFMYVIILAIVCVIIFSPYANAMFSVQNHTDRNEYRKYNAKQLFNEKYDYDSTYIDTIRIRLLLEKGNEDPKWIDKGIRDFPKIDLPEMDKTSSPEKINSPTYTSHICAYVTASAKTTEKEGEAIVKPCYVGFSEVNLLEPVDVKKVRVIFNGLNDNFEPMIDFEVNEKNNVIHSTNAKSFVKSHCKPFNESIK